MKIAIYGLSCTGKTTIAAPLAKELGFDLRSCGEEIKKRAKELDVKFDDLTDEIHHTIDNETVKWFLSNVNCVVEGRFLDAVLSMSSDNIVLIKLTATVAERCNRMKKRGNADYTIDDLCRVDEIDKKFRHEHYRYNECIAPMLTIDTSIFSVEQCLNQIKTKLQELTA